MSIFRVISNEDNNIDSLQRKLIYITRATATLDCLIYGNSVSVYYPYEEMLMVKESFNQSNGKAYLHYVLNLDANDNIDTETFFEMAKKIANFIGSFYGNYQVVMTVHLNVENHIHMHCIANNIDYLTGNRMNLDMKKLHELKIQISKIVGNYGVSAIRQQKH